jgi:glycogen operon protein
VNALRRLQQRNFLATLLLSQGSPMILAGDELGRTQQGNNNAYCQDNEISWIDWANTDAELFLFTRRLIALRAEHPVLRRQRFFTGRVVGGGLKDVRWLRRNGVEMTDEDWGSHERQSLAMILDGGLIADRTATGERIVDETLAVLLHGGVDPCEWDLPRGEWEVLLDTARPAEEPASRLVKRGTRLDVAARSLVVLRLLKPPVETPKGAPAPDATAEPAGKAPAGAA